MTSRLWVTGDAEVAVDAGAIAVGSLAICLAAHRLPLMTALLPALVLARTALWYRVTRPRAAPLLPELVYLALCTGIGAFNDWSSVVVHGIYAYTVPVYAPSVTTIPGWMLLFWGLVLRLFTTVGSWSRLGASPAPRSRAGFGPWHVERPWLKIALLLLLVLTTRQTIYRLYLHPWGSWLPFAGAALLYPVLFGLDRHEARLAGLTLVVGPLVEVLYIQVAGLHRYPLGWLGGVPLWIALWWVVSVLAWKDLGARIQAGLISRLAPGHATAPATR